jgi:hypothetical protein
VTAMIPQEIPVIVSKLRTRLRPSAAHASLKTSTSMAHSAKQFSVLSFQFAANEINRILSGLISSVSKPAAHPQ